jgi:hypothetical protein
VCASKNSFLRHANSIGDEQTCIFLSVQGASIQSILFPVLYNAHDMHQYKLATAATCSAPQIEANSVDYVGGVLANLPGAASNPMPGQDGRDNNCIVTLR